MNRSNLFSRRKALTAIGTAGITFVSSIQSAAANPIAATLLDKKKKYSGIQFYENIATMSQDVNLKKGDIVQTLGYYLAGDGGGAIYRIISHEKDTSADGGSLIYITNDLMAMLLSTTCINYKMFGAIGNSEQDDGKQIKAAHAYANKLKIPVINLGGEYWIKETTGISIQTNVQWGHSIFHIDERFNLKGIPRFEVSSYQLPQIIELAPEIKTRLLNQLKPGVKLIPELAKYKNSLVIIVDEDDRIGYRAGASKSKGRSWAKEELFYVEEDGRIIGDIAWEFHNYTELIAYPASESYLIIEGGTFYLSGDNPGKIYDGYWSNGFHITRSRTIIRNQWVGLEKGKEDISLTPRSGFYSFSKAYDVALENIRLIPWQKDRIGKENDLLAGTYGISLNRILQSRFFNITAEGGTGYWGVFGNNLNKHFFIDQCKLNRVDVHFHCWNLHIKDSSIGSRGITVTGGGDLLVENTTVWSRDFISFRQDYGAKWDGSICISNCRFMPATTSDTVVLNFTPADFAYHYPIGFGRTIRISELVIDYSAAPESKGVCRLMKIPSFSRMKNGQRLFFPNQIEFRNISVEGRKQGVRLLEIPMPQLYQLQHEGGYEDGLLYINSKLIFDNIQLEKIEAQEPGSTKSVHFLINANPGENYIDEFALYPQVCIMNCDHLTAYIGGKAEIILDHCTVHRFTAGFNAPLQGSVEFSSCKFKPVIKSDDSPFFTLLTTCGVSFTNCLLLAPEVNSISQPSLVDRMGFIEINKIVRYNHLNTKLGNDILSYCKHRGIAFNPKFIGMLKSHHEMESEKV